MGHTEGSHAKGSTSLILSLVCACQGTEMVSERQKSFSVALQPAIILCQCWTTENVCTCSPRRSNEGFPSRGIARRFSFPNSHFCPCQKDVEWLGTQLVCIINLNSASYICLIMAVLLASQGIEHHWSAPESYNGLTCI